MIEIGAEAPLFHLTDLRGVSCSLAEIRGWIIVFYFWSAECIWCERVDDQLMGYLDAWDEQVKVLWIASNANESLALIESTANDRNLPTVILDEHQTVANLYGAETTPHFFIVDTKGILAYQGAWDDISFRQRVATQVYVPQVVESLKRGLTPLINYTQPYGCMLVRFHDSKG